MAKKLDEVRKETVRILLWGMRNELLPHLMEDHNCYVRPVVEEMVARAEWDYDSFFLAVFFNSGELLVETGEGA